MNTYKEWISNIARIAGQLKKTVVQYVQDTRTYNKPVLQSFRILAIMETSISNISRIVENDKSEMFNISRIWGYEPIDTIRFPIFPGLWSANLIFSIHFAIRFRLEINLIMTPRNYNNYPRPRETSLRLWRAWRKTKRRLQQRAQLAWQLQQTMRPLSSLVTKSWMPLPPPKKCSQLSCRNIFNMFQDFN